LTASTGTWSGTQPITYAYKWQSCTSSDPTTCSDIPSQTASTYQLQSTDVGNYIRVVVSASNSAGGPVSATSTLVGPVQSPPPPPSMTAAPSISGPSGPPTDGQTLTASPGTWSGTQPITYAYQWQSCSNSDPASCTTNINGATASTYQLKSADVGSYVRVKVTATNSGGQTTAYSGLVGPVVAAAPSNTSLPTVSGSAIVAQTLTANTGSWSGTPPIGYTYQWKSCITSATSSCSPILTATGPTYQVASGDLNSYITVAITASNAGGTSTATANPVGPVTSSPIANAGFETGSWSPWVPAGTPNTSPPAAPAPRLVTPQTGRTHNNSAYAALLGFTGTSAEPTGDSWIKQTFTVPASGGTLSFYVWEFTTDSVRWDWQTCQIQNPSGTTLATLFKEAGNGQAWIQKSYSLSNWKGQTVALWCNVHEDGWGDQTYMYMDDFAVR
jgi:hypothetical protein